MALSNIPTWVKDISSTTQTKLNELKVNVQVIINNLDSGYTPPAPPPPIADDYLYFQNWEDRFNQIISNLEAYKIADKTGDWNRLTISISSYTKVMDSEKKEKPLLDQIKADAFFTFGGMTTTLLTLDMQTMSLTDLDGLVTQSGNSIDVEKQKIETFANAVNSEIQKIATQKLLSDKGTLSTIKDVLGLDKAYKSFGIMS